MTLRSGKTETASAISMEFWGWNRARWMSARETKEGQRESRTVQNWKMTGDKYAGNLDEKQKDR